MALVVNDTDITYVVQNNATQCNARCNNLQHLLLLLLPTLQHVDCNTVSHTATHCKELQCALQHAATDAATSAHTATHCKHIATHCNT